MKVNITSKPSPSAKGVEWFTWDEYCDGCGKTLYKSGEFRHITPPDDLPDFCMDCAGFGLDNKIKWKDLALAVKAEIQKNEDPVVCPKCNADLVGDPIPENWRGFYGGHTHYSRAIGLSNWDSVTDWKCPDCGHMWPRKKGLG